MLTELAARLVFAPLATAPPDLAAILGQMHATRPVEVFLLVVLFATQLAHFDRRVEISFFLNQSNYFDPQFRFLFNQRLNLLFLLSVAELVLFKCLLQLLYFKVHPLDFGFACLLKNAVFVNNLGFYVVKLICFLSERVALSLQLDYVLVFFVQFLKQLLLPQF